MKKPAAHPLDPTLRGSSTTALEKVLRDGLLAQDHVIDAILPSFQRYFAGLNNPDRPVGSFLFLGPTGVGKTHVAGLLAQHFHGNPRSMVRIDCAEFSESHEVAKLLGSPPGYSQPKGMVPRLHRTAIERYSDAKERRPGILLFDEIEKAHPDFSNISLGITSSARLTTSDGIETDFSNTVVIFTSNLGAREIKAMTQGSGFGTGTTPDSIHVQKHRGQIAKTAAAKFFSPEFMGRIEVREVFNSLGPDDLRKVLGLELRQAGLRFLASDKVRVVPKYTESALNWFLRQGSDKERGARDLTQCIDRSLVTHMASLAETGQIAPGAEVLVDVVDDRLTYYTQ